MCCKSFWKKLIPFAVALTLGILAAAMFQKGRDLREDRIPLKSPCKQASMGGGGGGARGEETETRLLEKSRPGTNDVLIFSKPRPSYTAAARENQVVGTVRLRVVFLASGQVGDVWAVSALPYGLTEQAIEAARQIRFEPARANGIPQTVSKTLEYSFSIY